MATMQTPVTVYETEKNLFKRILDLGVKKESAKQILAFWLWLETKGLEGIVKKISSQNDDNILAMLGFEAYTALASLQAEAETPTTSTIRLPETLKLVELSFSLEDIFEDREKAQNGMSTFLSGVCGVVYEDVVNEETKSAQKWVVKEEGAPIGGLGVLKSPVERLSSGPKLNPLAEEWKPTHEDERSLYITFSNGFPLSQHQIYLFFTTRYGPCLERIYIHQPVDGPPHFGRIVFKASYFPALVLNGQEVIKLRLFGRSMWCKRFRSKINNGAGSSA